MVHLVRGEGEAVSEARWTLDAAVATDADGRVAAVLGRYEDLPEGWSLVVGAPIDVDGLGNFGAAGTGRLPDRTGIERLVLRGEDDLTQFSGETPSDIVRMADALITATEDPLDVPRLLTKVAQLLSVMGIVGFREHPAMRGVPIAPAGAEGSRDALWRAPFLDGIILRDTTLLLHGVDSRPELVVLDGAPALIWAAADGRDVDETVARAASSLVADPAVPSALRDAVRELRDRSLLRSEPAWRPHSLAAWVDGRDYAALLAVGAPEASPLMLEGSAYSVWRHLCSRQATDIDDLLSEIARQYGVHVRDIDADVRGLLQRLGEHSAVVYV
jgi:Arc/MetJ family transcription regulator